jgi:hypothetical protein
MALFVREACFGRHVKPLVPAAFAVVSTHQPALGLCGGYGPLSLCVSHKESLCPSSGDINRLMMILTYSKAHLQEIVRCCFKLKLDLDVILSLSN